eukprot:NODE_2679_length_409_cov_15492.927778_g2598_i0.p1 GENE.NODE_2679_length_409_cov_15492.927778_g2598_i0~~NODE_2679_length_409_cov_15492.927778_g2598_i0.p1  ORF type:complete len:86 (+),score=11.13 NODE_2679_length_409_cov_15492.927778_g2598_i0:65-322(+)
MTPLNGKNVPSHGLQAIQVPITGEGHLLRILSFSSIIGYRDVLTLVGISSLSILTGVGVLVVTSTRVVAAAQVSHYFRLFSRQIN